MNSYYILCVAVETVPSVYSVVIVVGLISATASLSLGSFCLIFLFDFAPTNFSTSVVLGKTAERH